VSPPHHSLVVTPAPAPSTSRKICACFRFHVESAIAGTIAPACSLPRRRGGAGAGAIREARRRRGGRTGVVEGRRARLGAALATQFVEREASGDAGEPGAEAALVADGGEAVDGADEGRLDDFGGLAPVADDAGRDAQHVGMLALVPRVDDPRDVGRWRAWG
jgi:hypothetical protein